MSKVTTILAVVGSVLVAIPIGQVLAQRTTGRRGPRHVISGRRWSAVKPTGAVTAPPDICYIILDGFARSDVLADLYRYSDHQFISFLQGRGFFVASRSTANYTSTFLSLASSLNLGYPDYPSGRAGTAEARDLTYALVQDNELTWFLKAQGYRFITFSSGFVGPTDHNPGADVEYHFGMIDDFASTLIMTTPLKVLQKYIATDPRHRITGTFRQLSRLPRVRGPKFTFVHLLAPHPPYLFDENGRGVADPDLALDDWVHTDLYVAQLAFVSREISIVVDSLLANSTPLPIIVLQADHGPASTQVDSDWTRTTDEFLWERTGILNAYFLPEGGSSLLYDSITPVNTFRIILAYYFNADYPLLADRIYYSNYISPYELRDVTEAVREANTARH